MKPCEGKPTSRKPGVNEGHDLLKWWFPMNEVALMDSNEEEPFRILHSVTYYCCLSDEDFQLLLKKASVQRYSSWKKRFDIPAVKYSKKSEGRRDNNITTS